MTNAIAQGLFCMAMFLSGTLAGQVAPWLTVRVVQTDGGGPIAGAHILLSGSEAERVMVTDAQGEGVVQLARAGVVELTVTHIAHEDLTQHWLVTRDTTVTVTLMPRFVEIPMVVVRAAAPEVVYQRDHLHVGDHQVNDEGIWVLAYEQPRLWHSQHEAGAQFFQRARLVLLDTLFQERDAYPLPGEVSRLHRDHKGRVVVEGRHHAWVAEWRSDRITLGQVGKDVLQERILPWTDSTAGRLYGSDRHPEWPAFAHLAYDPVRDTLQRICLVQDDHVMALFRSQYKYMSGHDKVRAMDIEIATGVEREVVAGFMTGFQHDPYFRVPYAPLFIVRDTLCVFDHVRSQIRRFTVEGASLGEVPMQHSGHRNWRGDLVQDLGTGSVYARFAKGERTWLRHVDVHTGELGGSHSITHPFPEEVQVHEGHAYYVYRPQGGRDHRTLFRERLR